MFSFDFLFRFYYRYKSVFDLCRPWNENFQWQKDASIIEFLASLSLLQSVQSIYFETITFYHTQIAELYFKKVS